MKKLFLVLAVVCLFGCLEETKTNNDVSYIYFLQEDFAGKTICIIDESQWSKAAFNTDGSLTQSDLWPGDHWYIQNGKLIINGHTYLMLEDNCQYSYWTVQRQAPDGSAKIVYMFYNQVINADAQDYTFEIALTITGIK